MRIAVFSDVHGNCVGLDAMLQDLHNDPADQLVCLGDAIQGGPQPAQVVARLRELGCPVVMGNADAWLLTGREMGHEAITPERLLKMQSIRNWSLRQLSDGDRDFILRFQPTVAIEAQAGQRLLCFHGSPGSFDDIILPKTPEVEFRGYLANHAALIFAGGHTHIQNIRRVGDGFYFNPGSVGFAYSHEQDEGDFRADPWAEYAVLTLEPARAALEFRRVPYDADRIIRAYRESGRPHADEAAEQYEARR